MNSTARRVPRITGLPVRTSGSTTMGSRSGIPTVYLADTRSVAVPSAVSGLFDLHGNPSRTLGRDWCTLVAVGNGKRETVAIEIGSPSEARTARPLANGRRYGLYSHRPSSPA